MLARGTRTGLPATALNTWSGMRRRPNWHGAAPRCFPMFVDDC